MFILAVHIPIVGLSMLPVLQGLSALGAAVLVHELAARSHDADSARALALAAPEAGIGCLAGLELLKPSPWWRRTVGPAAPGGSGELALGAEMRSVAGIG